MHTKLKFWLLERGTIRDIAAICAEANKKNDGR